MIEFGDDLSSEEVEEIRTRAAAAKASFETTLSRLIEIAGARDPVDALARLAITTISGQSRFGHKGYDPLLQVYHLEIFQALALASDRKDQYDASDMPDSVQEIIELINKNADAYRDMRLDKVSTDARSVDYLALIEQLRTSTQTVRGARHAYQTRQYLRDLAEVLDKKFSSTLGFTLTFVLDAVEAIGFKLDDRLNIFRSRQKPWLTAQTAPKMMQLFESGNPNLVTTPEYVSIKKKRTVSLQEVKYVQWNLVENEFKDLFCFSFEDLDFDDINLGTLLDRISIGFGDLGIQDLERMHLSNPVCARPLVSVGESSFMLPNPQSLFAFLVEIVDGIIEPHPKLKAAAAAAKARWLEEKLFAVLRKAFPSGELLENVDWNSGDGEVGEADAVLLIDKVAALFEAKSGRVSPPALRGGHERLQRDLGRLLVEPSNQSWRLQTLLQEAQASVDVVASGRPRTIDPSQIREFARTNIVFQTIGALSSSWPRLVAHGLVPADVNVAPVMSIFDLETILDALPLQTYRLHYLKRRTELERNVTYLADELDLLATYFESGFNLGEAEFATAGINMYGMSDSVARCYNHEGRDPGFDLLVKQIELFRQLVERNESLAPIGWSRFGFRLCSLSYREQIGFRKVLQQLLKKGRKLKPPSSVHSGIVAGPAKRQTGIAMAVGKGLTEEMIINHASDAAYNLMSHSDIDTTLVLYWDSGSGMHEYRYIATMNRFSALPMS